MPKSSSSDCTWGRESEDDVNAMDYSLVRHAIIILHYHPHIGTLAEPGSAGSSESGGTPNAS
eukprot:COSAG06_NODE_28391_length_575_cov_0.926471_1_plen_61_part_10